MLVPIAETQVLRAKITPHPWAVALSMAAPMAANRSSARSPLAASVTSQSRRRTIIASNRFKREM